MGTSSSVAVPALTMGLVAQPCIQTGSRGSIRMKEIAVTSFWIGYSDHLAPGGGIENMVLRTVPILSFISNS